ncbi:VIT family protein [uncultured Shewanella sp.]|uniref:VIT1/CCC1 transporter family protein n=1 Tax=uncultured Shewanella sp. TaxID=173975 RepID=UPI002635D813|nr:VIT family protein [uncultured Shewanella sp.]
MSRHELHRMHRIGWLRAAVLGANDGIVSTASLIIGVAAAHSTRFDILLAGMAGLVAGGMSMAAGEYVSVSSQADIEKADLALEKASLNDDIEFEEKELADIYRHRGLEPELAHEVAKQLMEHDALAAHARDELGITDTGRARPLQAAMSSASMFTLGASLPLLVAWWAPLDTMIVSISSASLLFLAVLGMLAARVGGASMKKGAVRVLFWGALAMLLSAAVGKLFGVVV